MDGWRIARADGGRDLFGDRGDPGLLGQAQDNLGWDHVLRAWTLGTDGDVGTLQSAAWRMLMVQYCSGGKWGLLLRRPLEAMSRTLPLVFVYWLVVAIFMKKLYICGQTTPA